MDKQTKLINYLPEFLRDIREYKALTMVEDAEIDLIWKGVQAAFDDQTVDTATNYGISRLEKILNIVPESMNEEVRKTEIKTRLGQQLPYTMNTLEQTLTEFCGPRKSQTQEELAGYKLEILPEYTLKVLISLWNKSKKGVIDAMIRQMCPANMLCLVDLKYNTYGDLRNLKLTYGQLGNLTCKEIREEVVEDFFINTYEELQNLGLTHKKLENLTHQQIQDGFKRHLESIAT